MEIQQIRFECTCTVNLNRKSVSTILNGVFGFGTRLSLYLSIHTTYTPSAHQYICAHIATRMYTIEVIQLWVVSPHDLHCATVCGPFTIKWKGNFETVLLPMWPRAEIKPNCRKKILLFISRFNRWLSWSEVNFGWFGVRALNERDCGFSERGAFYTHRWIYRWSEYWYNGKWTFDGVYMKTVRMNEWDKERERERDRGYRALQ